MSKRDSQIANVDLLKAISWKLCMAGGNLVLITNRNRIRAFDCTKIGDLE